MAVNIARGLADKAESIKRWVKKKDPDILTIIEPGKDNKADRIHHGSKT